MKQPTTLFYGDRANCDHHPDPQEILQYITRVVQELGGDAHSFEYIIAKEVGGINGQEHWQIVVGTQLEYGTIKPNELRNAKLKFKWKSSAQNSTSMFTVKRQMSEDDPLLDEKWSYPLKEYAGLYSDTEPYFANENIITNLSAESINDMMYKQREEFIPHYARTDKITKLSAYHKFMNSFENYLEMNPYTYFHNCGAYAFDLPAGIEYITKFILEYYHIQREWFEHTKFSRQMNAILNSYSRESLIYNFSQRFQHDNKYLWVKDAYNPLNLKSL